MVVSDTSQNRAENLKFYQIKTWEKLLGRQPRLLVVEDDREILRSVMEWFEFDSWKVRGVDDGSAFFEVVEPVISGGVAEEYFDVVITDISMPGIDVIAILEGLRKVGCTVPIAVISALPDPALPQRVHDLGRAKFFTKPFQIGRLHETARQLLMSDLEAATRH